MNKINSRSFLKSVFGFLAITPSVLMATSVSSKFGYISIETIPKEELGLYRVTKLDGSPINAYDYLDFNDKKNGMTAIQWADDINNKIGGVYISKTESGFMHEFTISEKILIRKN